ncbi:tripartite tricarboxylate transporter TctB family protein [Pannonibacter carbonis]|uniref:tripartite tricarboxylate transporter TctB family protein n=1 Tax=Pannonibacter carbonis TaxID=2067569 RepID=UPI000D0F6715|nr:tripartite tricarboxylate transporter TctB family protein [Pannonibacter carbonis]
MQPDDPTPHVFPTARRPGELLFAMLFLGLSVLLLAQIGWQTTWLPGKGLAAQPRTWPFVGLAGMVLFGTLHLIATNRVRRTPGRWQEAMLWLRSLEFVAWYLVYVFSVPYLGYLPATLVFCLSLTWRCGYRSRVALFAAAGFGLGVVFFFRTLLSVKIPGGALYDALPAPLDIFFLTYF